MPAATVSVSPSAAIDLIRAQLGDRYALVRELGRGGMGTVYLARDVRLDRLVALKVLPPEFAKQSTLRERFLLETRTAAGFSHPNIVPVYAVEESEDLLAYAMGLVEGETVASRVERVGPLTVREIVRVLQDVGYALAYAHGRGVVHRDIKPDNIMLERATGRALVMDFGISRSMMQAPAGHALTRVGEVVGTPEYMSPEQASGDHVDGRSDLYALGLTAHFAATGRVAMTGDSTQKILVKQLTEPVPSIAASRPDLPPVLRDAIDRCVEKDPEHRFATAEALVDAIDAGQLAEPEIPLPVRLFAGEASTLSTVALGVLLFSLYMTSSLADADEMSSVDIIGLLVGLLAVLVARALTTLGEARQLAVAGFSADDVMAGLARVMAERSRRRAELAADPALRRRRRRILSGALLMLTVAIAMIWTAFEMRVEYAPGMHGSRPLGVALVSSGIAILGMSAVLLIKSPFRMPIGERLFRLTWLGPPGRLFVRLAGRGVRTGPPGLGRRASSEVVKTRASGVTASSSAGAETSPAQDRLSALETRVTALERRRTER